MATRNIQNRGIKERIAKYLLREWERYERSEERPTARAFAKSLGVHEGTVSKVRKGKLESVGIDLFIALSRRVNATDMLMTDPAPDLHVRPTVRPAATGPPGQSPARHHGSGR